MYLESNPCSKIGCCASLFIRYNAPMAVTRRQKEVIDFLEAFVARNGYSPSFEEIARGMGLKSLATVHKHITNLEKKGLLDRVHNRSRSIDLLPPGSRTRSSLKLPLAGVLRLELRWRRWKRRRPSRWPMLSATAMSLPLRCAETPCATSTSSMATTCSWSAHGRRATARLWWRWCTARKRR